MKRTITRNQFLRSGQVTRRARIYGACGLAIALIAAMGALVVWAQPTLGTAERGDQSDQPSWPVPAVVGSAMTAGRIGLRSHLHMKVS